MRHRPFISTGVGIALLLTIAACNHPLPRSTRLPAPEAVRLSPSETIAGEILAYLMEVVLGRAGPRQGREAWASRGADLPLDFDLVVKRMTGPVPLRMELMVLDTNILGLTTVLYHYDRRLNLFKGLRGHDSLYPCAELMGLRLFLLHRLDRGRPVNLTAVVKHRARFTDGGEAPTAALAAMHLDRSEFRFLQAIFQSEPVFMRYLQHPFIVSTLRRIGAVEPDALTVMADQATSYRRWACSPPEEAPPATVAILPSMTGMFTPADTGSGGVAADPEYRELVARLQAAIRAEADRAALPVSPAAGPIFFTPGRPMVVHPANAGRVVAEVCPTAAFTVILLGKNVYRALAIDPGLDTYPHERRIYVDLDDIRYGEIDDAAATVVRAILPAMAAFRPSTVD